MCTGADQNNHDVRPEKIAKDIVKLNVSGANQGAFLQLSWGKHSVSDYKG